jgi:hypothetical protein
MASKTAKTASDASSPLLHPSLYEGRAVAPVTKAELQTILEFFAAGINQSAPIDPAPTDPA